MKIFPEKAGGMSRPKGECNNSSSLLRNVPKIETRDFDTGSCRAVMCSCFNHSGTPSQMTRGDNKGNENLSSTDKCILTEEAGIVQHRDVSFIRLESDKPELEQRVQTY